MDEMDKAQAASEVYEDAAFKTHFARRLKPSPILAIIRNCEDCGNPIPAARIKANPEAIRCIGCQTIFERSVE